MLFRSRWHMPAHVTHGQDQADMGQFVMLAVVLVAFAGALGALGWVVSRVTVLLFGSPSPGGGVSGLLPIAAIGVIAYFLVSRSQKRGASHG